MDKIEKIRIIMQKVTELEHEAFCLGIFLSDIDKSGYEKHYQSEKGCILCLYDLLEDLL